MSLLTKEEPHPSKWEASLGFLPVLSRFFRNDFQSVKNDGQVNMADPLPVISISTEDADAAANWSLSDSEDANKAKATIASRMRRRHRKKAAAGSGGGKPILVVHDDGEESGLTDVETVEVDSEGVADRSNASSHSPTSPAEDFTPIFDAVLKPQIVEIVDDHDGKTRVKTVVKGVVAKLVDDDDDDDDEVDDDENDERGGGGYGGADGGASGLSLREALTDVESLDEDSNDETGQSDSSEMERAVQMALQLALEQGGSVDTHQQEEEVAASSCRGPRTTAVSSGPALLCPKAVGTVKKRHRKTRSKKKAASSAPTPSLLAVTTPDDDPQTDVESISGVEQAVSEEVDGSHPVLRVKASGDGLLVPQQDDDGATDVEDFNFSDDDGGRAMAQLAAPGIVVTREYSDTESAQDCNSGRSSRLGLTDVESVSGVDDGEYRHSAAAVSLSLPRSSAADPLTDVEDIDDVEVDADVAEVQPIPRNGPATHGAQFQVVTIQEDENGTVTNRKSARSPMLLNVANSDDGGGGVSDVEFLGVSGDEEEGAQLQPDTSAPEVEGSTVYVKRHSISTAPNLSDLDGDTTTVNATTFPTVTSSLMPPTVAAELLTDTEDMEVSDAEPEPGLTLHPEV